jgi:hypothetical protein
MGFLSWLNDLFEPHEEYGTPSVTITGQPVRSKSERVIADYFTRHGIPYHYEAMATTNDWFIFKAKISRPDFYLPQYNLYVEYWGLVDSPDPRTRDNYVRTMRWKMAQYRNNNIRFISIYPSNLNDLDYYFKRKFREVMGFNFPIDPNITTCPICHQQILDMPLHIKWHTQNAPMH